METSRALEAQGSRSLGARPAIRSVWAPFAEHVSLVIDGRRTPMARTGEGWWTSPEVEPDADYMFSVDGGDPLPDPRSPWQPHGVHGASRPVDHSAFTWSDRHWQAKPISAAVLYELHIGTFTEEGTFQAASGRLDHLVDLGVTHVEIMPVAQYAGSYGWGYDGVCPFAPHHEQGGPEGLKKTGRHVPSKGARRPARRRLQPPRTRRQLLAAVRSLFHRAASHSLGSRTQL